MGRRSRKRAGSSHAAGEPSLDEPVVAAPRRDGPARGEGPQAPRRRRARIDEAPQPPWHPFPLVELTILAGIILLAFGYFSEGGGREVLFVGGLSLIFAASLELTIREHVSGYRSHSSLLALACAFLVGAPVYLVSGNRLATVIAAVVGGILAFLALRALFGRRSGGMTWRA